jgi:hypothetical protein
MRLLSIALALVVLGTSAHAASITVERDGCNPRDCYRINIKGDIKLEDFPQFEKIIGDYKIKNALVYLDSNGGNMVGGLLMGYSIKEHGFSTYVHKDTVCVSVCAAMWMAGYEKYYHATAAIGFHSPFSYGRNGRKVVNREAVNIVKQYYARVGVPKQAIDFLVSASPDNLFWLNADLVKGFGINANRVVDEDEEKKTAPVASVGRKGDKL